MNKLKSFAKFIFPVLFLLFLSGANFVNAANIGDIINFNVDKDFDASARTQMPATLVKSTNNLYFYIEKLWWDSQSRVKQLEILSKLESLSQEFDNKIYPTLTSAFGTEARPGIDKDNKIYVLFEDMDSTEGGYFREADGYIKLQIPTSNEKEMLYLSLDYIDNPQLKIFFAHEFTHLITFNQKNILLNAEEDTWLNEARAEYAPTLLGYNNIYQGSYLEKRVQDFSEKPTGSLIDWQGTKYDYGKINLFVHYLVDQYGMNILKDSLHSSKVGIESITYALQKNVIKENFSQIFTNWTIATLVNDCNYGSKYCYTNKNLEDFNLVPQINFLPLTGNTTLTMSDNAKSWSVNWYKIIGGGGGTLKFNFEGDFKVDFNVVYITKNQSGAYMVKMLALDSLGRGEFDVSNFGKDVTSLFVIPYLKGDNGGISDSYFHSFFWSASMTRQDSNTEEINKLLAIIDSLKKQIAAILAQKQVWPVIQNDYLCSQIVSNLSLGASGSEVSCLQTFLKNQGGGIYPEGYVTGNFGNLTKSAVIKFQEKYASDILTPFGISNGTGYVGAQTRMKINQILNAR